MLKPLTNAHRDEHSSNGHISLVLLGFSFRKLTNAHRAEGGPILCDAGQLAAFLDDLMTVAACDSHSRFGLIVARENLGRRSRSRIQASRAKDLQRYKKTR